MKSACVSWILQALTVYMLYIFPVKIKFLTEDSVKIAKYSQNACFFCFLFVIGDCWFNPIVYSLSGNTDKKTCVMTPF